VGQSLILYQPIPAAPLICQSEDLAASRLLYPQQSAIAGATSVAKGDPVTKAQWDF
tara:strand:- start:3049 stop:3216 length:168 start_codon:yes stop_codon:yes gene_type:complete